MATGFQHAKKVLADKVLDAVKEFESTSGLSVIELKVPQLKSENSSLDDAIQTSEASTSQ